MAVRRAVTADAGRKAADLPEHLRECVVEDWVDPTREVPPDYWFGGTIPSTAVDWFQIVAWNRHGEALDAWGDKHGLSTRDVHSVASRGQPRFRNYEAFVATVKEHCL